MKHLSDDEKFLLKRYLEEWKITNQYVNDIDRGYGSFLTVFAAIAGGTVTLLTIINENKLHGYFFYIVPICFLVAFGYLSYQFRITAILRGHLSYLEDEMNSIIAGKIFLWNSVLTDTHMAHNNVPNKFLMVPILLFVICTTALCFSQTYRNYGSAWYNILYWFIIFVCTIVEFVPFFRNDKIREETRNNKKVIQIYNMLKSKPKNHQDKNTIR